MSVLFDKRVEEYLNELVDVLYGNDYFGLKSSAYDYVEWIIDTVEQEIYTIPCKIAPTYFSRYGKNLYYSVFKRNNNTQWYVFFNLIDDLYYIRYIGNNHNCAQFID
mgnify:FL=1